MWQELRGDKYVECWNGNVPGVKKVMSQLCKSDAQNVGDVINVK